MVIVYNALMYVTAITCMCVTDTNLRPVPTFTKYPRNTYFMLGQTSAPLFECSMTQPGGSDSVYWAEYRRDDTQLTLPSPLSRDGMVFSEVTDRYTIVGDASTRTYNLQLTTNRIRLDSKYTFRCRNDVEPILGFKVDLVIIGECT